MDSFKEYTYELRKLSFGDPYLEIHADITPKLKHYIRLLDEVKFTDGSYHTYYGEIKRIINSFITCWSKTMDEAIKVADRHANVTSKNDLLEIMENTLSLNKTKHIDFAKDFLPVQSRNEQELYEEVERSFDEFMDRLYEFRNKIEKLDKQEKIELFAVEHFPVSVEKKNEVFLFTYNYICNLLTKRVDRINVSLEEILLRARNNLKEMQENCSTSINSLLNQLYDKNKEHLNIFRQETRSSLEVAEVQRSMEIIKDKIEDYKGMPVARLVDEFKYWQKRNLDFKHIQDALKKLNEHEKYLLEQEKIMNTTIPCPEIQNPNSLCWGATAKQLQANLQALRDMKTKAGKALITFFSVQGPDRVISADNVGPYYIDDYGHQVYFFDYGLKLFHVNCDGQFVEMNENEKYYYDHIGRYVIDNGGSKLYQIGPCTSTYQLTNDVFVKHTKDCGHSERDMEGCRMRLRDPNEISILPLTEAVDLNDILDPSTSKYLWDSFGHILPLALRDVAVAKPKNPIHYLAHKLLYHKYSKSHRELREMKEEAGKYKENIFQDRIDKAKAASKAWKAKQVKRRKPEESDDAAERFAYDAHVATQDFIRALNFYEN